MHLFNKLFLRLYGRWVLYYIRRERHFKYAGLSLKIPAGVFHPGLFFSTKVLINFLQKVDFQGKTLLDLGTGSGILALYAAKRGARATAVDINPRAVETARANALSNKLSIALIQSDLFLNIESQQFDIVLINPPYYAAKPGDQADFAFFAGEQLEYFEQLFVQMPSFLGANSRVWMVISKDCNLALIERYARESGFRLMLEEEKRVWSKSVLVLSCTYIGE
jgi:release factor glutamine methyltransferase